MQTLTKQLDQNGSLLISTHETEELGFKVGETVKVQINCIRPMEKSLRERLLRSQTLVQSIVPVGVSLADELIVERRLEAIRKASGE